MVTDKAVYELQAVISSEYGQNLSFEETRRLGLRLVSLYKFVLTDDQYLYKDKNYEPTK